MCHATCLFWCVEMLHNYWALNIKFLYQRIIFHLGLGTDQINPMIFRIWPDFGLIWSDLVFLGFDLNRSESYATRILTDLIWSDLIWSGLFRVWSESIWSDWWLTWSDLKWSDNLNAQNFYNFNNFRVVERKLIFYWKVISNRAVNEILQELVANYRSNWVIDLDNKFNHNLNLRNHL